MPRLRLVSALPPSPSPFPSTASVAAPTRLPSPSSHPVCLPRSIESGSHPHSYAYKPCSVGGGDVASCGLPASLLPKILIKGRMIVNAHHQELVNVYIEDGIIVSFRRNIMEFKILLMITGGIDPHMHLAIKFIGTETICDFFNGKVAALTGGTTMHIDFVIPVNESLTVGYESYLYYVLPSTVEMKLFSLQLKSHLIKKSKRGKLFPSSTLSALFSEEAVDFINLDLEALKVHPLPIDRAEAGAEAGEAKGEGEDKRMQS
ncbi:hypothetical protein ACLOJK_027787 [Asimina triloba]